ncbi:hypothetical protein [Colletotrichum higginsianum ssRNA virus 1]|nr:hypothetical protein [Colletotrichum higginsianum ssRNA virus 1]
MMTPIPNKEIAVYVAENFNHAEWDFLAWFVFYLVSGINWVLYNVTVNYDVVLLYPLYGSVGLMGLYLRAWQSGMGPLWWVLVAPMWAYVHYKCVRKWLKVLTATLYICWFYVGLYTVPGRFVELGLAYLMRGSKAPPAVQPAEVINDPALPELALAHLRGTYYAAAAQVKHSSLTAGGFTASRIRRRSKWVGSLQSFLGGRPGVVGELIKGRWTPDLPNERRALSANAVLATLAGESKLLGGGVVPTSDPDVHEPFLVVETRTGREVIVPSLLGRLARYSCFRERNPALLAGLRSRAQEWCADKKVADCVLPLIIPGACAMAFLKSAPEMSAEDSLLAEGYDTILGL